MPIETIQGTREFHLWNQRTSYILCVFANGRVGQPHFGAPLAAGRSYRHLDPRQLATLDNGAGDGIRFEYPTYGSGDFRAPALAIDTADGAPVLELVYAGHRILSGKPPIPGLPSTYTERDDEADTLEIELRDAPSGAVVLLSYTIFRDHPAVARSVRVRNGGTRPMTLRTAMSASLDRKSTRLNSSH